MIRLRNGALTILSCLFCLALLGLTVPEAAAEEQILFIASPGNPQAIYSVSLNTETGKFGEKQLAAENVNTGFLAVHPELPILYAATNEKVPAGEHNGHVRAYSIDAGTGALNYINQVPTSGPVPTHIEVSPCGKYLAVCHYSSDNTTLIPLNADGSLTKKSSIIRHTGSSVHPQRQKKPHPHGVAISADSRFVLVADLGNDHVEIFPVSENLELQPGSFWKAPPGAGPRHVSFHPNKKWLYSINELDSTMSVLEYNAETGALTEIETVTTLPEDFKEWNSTAEVVVHPSGKFLYGSNRGHNSTVVYQIDPQSGKLKTVQHEPTQGDHPRFVGLDPTGKIFVAANMNENNLVSFRIDQKTGKLTPTGNQLNVARPMCVLFVKK